MGERPAGADWIAREMRRHFLARIAKHVQRHLVDVEDRAGRRVMQKESVIGRVENLPVVPLAGAEQLFRLAAPGAFLDFAHGPLHRRSQSGQPLLQHVVGGPLMQGLDGGLFPKCAGDEDERDFGAFLLNGCQGSETIVGWQRVIGQDQIRRAIAELGQEIGFGRDALCHELDARITQLAHGQFGVGGPVFEDQEAEFAAHT